ncbi:MAG TPA: tetratricopeptide repeat protein [Myxococcaceae bacterium]|nr:tetratricopeptide repeat protein [Myxococcaceae bacterium]
MSARVNQLLEAGLWLKMSGDLDGARRLFEQALKLDPDSIRARELLGHSVPDSAAVPEELRDVPVTRTDLFSVPLPRLFQDEPPAPAAVSDEWWNAPPSDASGNTARFFVRPAQSQAPGEARPSTHTIPWGPSPLPPRALPAPLPGAAAVDPDFGGDDFGESGDDFGLELSGGTPAPLSRSGPRPVPGAGPPPPEPTAAEPSRTTGAIPLPPALVPGARSPVPGREPPELVQTAGGAPGSVPSRTTGAIPLPPAVAPVPGTPAPLPLGMAHASRPGVGTEPSRSTGPVPLPPAAVPVNATPAPGWREPPAGEPRPSPTLQSHAIVPLPAAKEPSGPMAPEPSPSLEPLPWAMPPSRPPAPLTTPSRGLGAVPLPGGPGAVLSHPRNPAAQTPAPPLPGAPHPDVALELTSDAWGGEGDGPTLLAPEGPAAALELLAEPRTVSGLTPLPAPRDPRSEAARMLERARELQNLDDHSGARELLLRAQALYPDLTGLSDALARSETKLQTIYESKIGKLSAVPRVRLKEDEVIWLNLDHRAGFMLAQIDGTLSFEDLFSVSGMSRLDTARILAQLLDQRVIIS